MRLAGGVSRNCLQVCASYTNRRKLNAIVVQYAKGAGKAIGKLQSTPAPGQDADSGFS